MCVKSWVDNVEFSIKASQNPVLVGFGVDVQLAIVVSLYKKGENTLSASNFVG